MPNGNKCPYCKVPMSVESEKKYPAGSDVVYKCTIPGCNHKDKVFEDK
ncbi:MAG: hypothetical protein ACI8ZM_000478 [Crocinitomix sp.]|jgi:hypothetical protein